LHFEHLKEGESDSSSASAASSVFNNSHKMSYSGHPPSLLTPVTNESSPPDKTLSPRSAKRSFEQMHGRASPYRAAAASASQDVSSITPSQTPPEPARTARPGPGEIKGWKLAFDPETAPGIDAKDRKKYKAKYNTFGDKVRAASSQVMMLT
jgi:histone-lysine N-methyltransferase SETD1